MSYLRPFGVLALLLAPTQAWAIEAVVAPFVPTVAEDVELLVTRQIEKALARIPQRDYIYSWSRDGKSIVNIKVLDAYTQDALSKGCDVEQLTEVAHVSAAIKGGAALVHGVQMRNAAGKLEMGS